MASTPIYGEPDWSITGGVYQSVKCGAPGIRYIRDTQHAAWIRREAKKRGLIATVTLSDGSAFVRLHRRDD